MSQSILDDPGWDQAASWQQLAEQAMADDPTAVGAATRVAGAGSPVRPRRGPILGHRRPDRSAAVKVLAVVSIVVVLVVVAFNLVSPSGQRRPANPTGVLPGAAPGTSWPTDDPGSGTAPATGAATAGAPPGSPRPSTTGTRSPAPVGPSSTTAGKPPAPPPSTSRTTAAASPVTPRNGLVVRLVNQSSGTAISVGSSADGSPIVASHSTGTGQQWRLVSGNGCYALVNVATGKALDNPDASHDDGTQMQLWSYTPGDANQLWCFTNVGPSLYSLLGYSGGCLLDLRDGGTADGTAVQQWGAPPEAPDAAQTWRLVAV